ncbi:MAG: hypothetical protein PUG54_01500 [Firmicutes bacterium]|nr:hypothetical protein [Bacillota bacterium]
MFNELTDETIRSLIEWETRKLDRESMFTFICLGIVGLILLVALIYNIVKNKILKRGEDTSKSIFVYFIWVFGVAFLFFLVADAINTISMENPEADFYVVETVVESKYSHSDGDYWVNFKGVAGSLEVCSSDYYDLSVDDRVYVVVDKAYGTLYACSFSYSGDKLKE